ncbi:N-acetyllactosaminide beta-1,3-N-acetylglucosaminyltransferase 3 [Oryzias melastigma]|uniref:Hexosyltransferase n=1 Tax=Oryzias melastigma TaxID=30732 RepID=A0A3B3CID9_ORYME|nr:N-acetyllactosaminide beta-1,3-N-acetylglucosaminyltransferase 3 [Oryzias melastigma]
MIGITKKGSTLPKAALLLLTVLSIVYVITIGETTTNTLPKPEVTDNSQTRTLQQTTTQSLPVKKCEKNASVTSLPGFDALPEIYKTFLYYRHCRYFPMLLDNPDKCGKISGEKEPFLLLVIKSSPQNYERREVLRKTWAQERMYKGAWIRRVFISGTSGAGVEKHNLNKLLKLENEDHHDILQWDFADSFYNLTLKQTLLLGWLEEQCPSARFLFNGDDDVFANTDNMVEYLQSINNSYGQKHLFTGHLLTTEKPVRWTGSKYFVPLLIQATNKYEPYCGGGGFLLSAYTASVIYKTSQEIPLHPIDDAYMGMCLFKVGLKPSSHLGVKTLGIQLPMNTPDNSGPCYMKELLLLHRFLPSQMYVMWKEVNDPNLICSTTNKLSKD